MKTRTHRGTKAGEQRVCHTSAMGTSIPSNPTEFSTAQAFWLNERPTWAEGCKTALGLRANFAEPQLLPGDLAYDGDMAGLTSPGAPRHRRSTLCRRTARQEYEKALAIRPGRHSRRSPL
jgi:hypothetical protein